MNTDTTSVNIMTATLPMIIFFATLLVLYFLALSMKKAGMLRFRGQYIKFLERVSLGWDRSILVFEVQNIYYIVFVDKNGMRVIDKRDDLTQMELKSSEKFSSILSKFSVDKN